MSETVKRGKYCVARYFTRREQFYSQDPVRYTRLHMAQEVEVYADDPTEAIMFAAKVMDANLDVPAANPVYKVKTLMTRSPPTDDRERRVLASQQIDASREQPLFVTIGRLP